MGGPRYSQVSDGTGDGSGTIEQQERKATPEVDLPVRTTPSQSLHGNAGNHDLRHRKRAIRLISLYLPVLVLPWIFTCIMMFRPIAKPSYINQIGKYSETDARHMERWHTAIDILNGIATVLAVPVCSALLAYGAIIYTQHRSTGQDLSIHQMFALADRG